MTSDPWTGARLGTNSDAPLGGSFLAETVQELAPSTRPSFASQSARDTAFTNWKTNGNTPVPGMSCFTRADGRAWRLAADLVTWLYAGGNPPPIVAGGAGAGWSIASNHPIGAFIDASGMVNVVGSVSPNTTYNPQDGGTHTAFTLPAGYRPATGAFGVAVVPYPVNAAVFVQIDTSGVGSIVGGSAPSIGPNSGHYLDGIKFHPTYAGSVPLS